MPVTILIYSDRMPSIARKASGTLSLLFAESSRVLSNHWVAAV